MFDTEKFGAFISYLRRESDMTQSELGDLLSVTRQAVSKYERGESFPDVSILRQLSEIFGVSLDILVNSGEPSAGESRILRNAACGRFEPPDSIGDVVSLAPLLKPSLLSALSESMNRSGIDISDLVSLSEYLSDSDSRRLLKKVSFDSIADMDKPLLERLLPVAGPYAAYLIFTKIIDGELGLDYLDLVYPYYEGAPSQIESAVMCGALDEEALCIMRRHEYNLSLRVLANVIPEIFTCPACGKTLRYFHPHRCVCGFKPKVKGCLYDFGSGRTFTPRQDYTDADELLRLAGSESAIVIAGCPDGAFLTGLCRTGEGRIIIADSDRDRLAAAEQKVRHISGYNIIFAQMNPDRFNIADGAANALIDLSGTPEPEAARILGHGGIIIRNGKVVFEKEEGKL